MRKEAGIIAFVVLVSVVFVSLILAGVLDGQITGNQILDCPGDYNGDGVVDYDDYFVEGADESVVDDNLGSVCEEGSEGNESVAGEITNGSQANCDGINMTINNVINQTISVQTLSINFNVGIINMSISRLSGGTSEPIDYKFEFVDSGINLRREEVNQLYADSNIPLTLPLLAPGQTLSLSELVFLGDWTGEFNTVKVYPIFGNITCGFNSASYSIIPAGVSSFNVVLNESIHDGIAVKRIQQGLTQDYNFYIYSVTNDSGLTKVVLRNGLNGPEISLRGAGDAKSVENLTITLTTETDYLTKSLANLKFSTLPPGTLSYSIIPAGTQPILGPLVNLARNKFVVVKGVSGVRECTTQGLDTQRSCCLANRNYLDSLNRCKGFPAGLTPVPGYAVDGELYGDVPWCSPISFKGGDDWIYVDLGKNESIEKVKVTQLANLSKQYACGFASDYALEVAYDGSNPNNSTSWTQIERRQDSLGVKEFNLSNTIVARYVRFKAYRVVDNTGWRLSVKEFEIYGREKKADLVIDKITNEAGVYKLYLKNIGSASIDKPQYENKGVCYTIINLVNSSPTEKIYDAQKGCIDLDKYPINSGQSVSDVLLFGFSDALVGVDGWQFFVNNTFQGFALDNTSNFVNEINESNNYGSFSVINAPSTSEILKTASSPQSTKITSSNEMQVSLKGSTQEIANTLYNHPEVKRLNLSKEEIDAIIQSEGFQLAANTGCWISGLSTTDIVCNLPLSILYHAIIDVEYTCPDNTQREESLFTIFDVCYTAKARWPIFNWIGPEKTGLTNVAGQCTSLAIGAAIPVPGAGWVIEKIVAGVKWVFRVKTANVEAICPAQSTGDVATQACEWKDYDPESSSCS